MAELDADFIKVTDESTYDRSGTVVRNKTYVFFLGKHGPFTERIPLEHFDEFEIGRRVETLRRHLASLPT